MNQQTLSVLIWSVADLLRGDYKLSDYEKVTFPFIVLRRLTAIELVVDRLLKRYKAARQALAAAEAKAADGPEAKAAKDELNNLLLFKRDLGTFVRVYAFLSQLFEYGNTAIEKRAIFFKHLLPLL